MRATTELATTVAERGQEMASAHTHQCNAPRWFLRCIDRSTDRSMHRSGGVATLLGDIACAPEAGSGSCCRASSSLLLSVEVLPAPSDSSFSTPPLFLFFLSASCLPLSCTIQRLIRTPTATACCRSGELETPLRHTPEQRVRASLRLLDAFPRFCPTVARASVRLIAAHSFIIVFIIIILILFPLPHPALLSLLGMDVIDASASPTANAGPQTPKSAKNAKKRGRWALGAESAVGEFSKRARHSLSTLCTLRST